MPKLTGRNIYGYFILAAILFLIVIAVIKTHHVFVLYDEAVTFFGFAKQPVDFILSSELPTANNHVLNSLFIRLWLKYLPAGHLALRLPNLIAFLLYLVFSWLLVKDFKSRWLRMSAFILLTAHPYLNDFFSLGRGYGLSIGFMMASLYFFRSFFEKQLYKEWNLLFCLSAGALAVLASFTMLNYYLILAGMCLVGSIHFLLKRSGYKGRELWDRLTLHLLINAMVTGLLLKFTLPFVLKLRASNELYFGGRAGFWQDTVNSLFRNMMYGQAYTGAGMELLQYLLMLAFIGLVFFLVVSLVRRKCLSGNSSFLWLLALILAGTVAAPILQYYLLGTNYPLDRTALYFVPLFFLLLVYLLDSLGSIYKVFSYLAAFLAGAAVVHFVFSFDAAYVYEWKGDARQAMQLLNERHTGKEAGQVTIHTSWIFQPELTFYADAWKVKWLKEIKMEEPGEVSGSGYWYGEIADKEMLLDKGWRELEQYPASNKVLLMKRATL